MTKKEQYMSDMLNEIILPLIVGIGNYLYQTHGYPLDMWMEAVGTERGEDGLLLHQRLMKNMHSSMLTFFNDMEDMGKSKEEILDIIRSGKIRMPELDKIKKKYKIE